MEHIEYLTKKEVMLLLKISSTTLYRHVKSGVIKQYRFGDGRRVYYKRNDLNNSMKLVEI